MDPFFGWLETTALSVWVRESPSLLAFPGVLTLHAIGMAFLAGTSIAIDLRTLGFAPGIELSAFRKFFPLIWIGFVINAFSGLMLLIAYPTKALTNPVFYLKLALIAAALVLLLKLDRTVLARGSGDGIRTGRRLAAASIACWVGAITAGRLLAYTYSRLLVDF